MWSTARINTRAKTILIYIHDLCNVSDLEKNFILFVDDTNIFNCVDDPNMLSTVANQELVKLQNWFAVKKLSLNVNKTSFMIFGKKRNVPGICITINQEDIERVYKQKFLGVIIDDKLSWKTQIRLVKSKLAKATSIIYKSRCLLDVKSRSLLYVSLFMPYIDYCSVLHNLWPIFFLQKRVIRIIFGAKAQDHTNNLFVNLNVMKFFDNIEYKTAITMYKVKYKLLPKNILKLFYSRDECCHVTRQRDKLHQSIVPHHYIYARVLSQHFDVVSKHSGRLPVCHYRP